MPEPAEKNASVADRSMLAILQQIEALPSLPAVANTILEQVLNQDFDHSKLARIIETDPALSVKILDHANSGTYASRGQISQVEQGLNRLGSKVVQTLMLSVLIKDSLIKGDKNSEAIHAAHWKHSLATAVYASLIAARSYPSLAGEAFGAGIMHDVGGIFLQLNLQEEYAKVTERMEELYEPVLDAEQEIFQTDHTAVGRWIAEKWNIPQSMTDAIWLHHHGAAALGALKVNANLVAIVALANILAHATLMDSSRVMAREKHRQAGLQEMLGLVDQDMQAILTSFAPAFAERAEPFALDGDQVSLFLTSLQKANQLLMRMGLDLEQANGRLEDANRFTSLGSKVGLKMSKSRTADEVFESAAQCMQEDVGIRGGFVYWVVPSQRVMQGMVWNGSGAQRVVTYPLDGDGLPVLDDGSALPDNIRAIVLSHHERHAGASLMDRELRLKQFFVVRGVLPFSAGGQRFHRGDVHPALPGPPTQDDSAGIHGIFPGVVRGIGFT
jgi:Predicted signal transduction protein